MAYPEKDNPAAKKRVSLVRLGQILISFFLFYLTMFLLWIILSGKFEPLMLILGAFSSLLVTVFSYNLVFTGPDILGYFKTSIKFLGYVPWLIYQIFKANFHVLYLVFHPKMMHLIDPHIIIFRTSLKKDFSIVTMANSITLTPGTITVTAELDGEFRVHAIDKASSANLPGVMEKKVGKLYGEE